MTDGIWTGRESRGEVLIAHNQVQSLADSLTAFILTLIPNHHHTLPYLFRTQLSLSLASYLHPLSAP